MGTKQYAYIYALIDPTNDKVRYVGCSFEPIMRYQLHLSQARNNLHGCLVENHAKREWQVKLKKLGLAPRLLILERVPRLKRVEREQYWIGHYGSVLFNRAMVY